MSAAPRHFLDLHLLPSETVRAILTSAAALKAKRKSGDTSDKPLSGRTLAMLFEKPSTRTRVSFQVGMQQLGGNAVTLSPQDTQLGRGESIADTARVLSRYCDVLMLRTSAPEKLHELAKYATS